MPAGTRPSPSVPGGVPAPFRSSPAQKPRPAPVSTTTRVPPSAATLSKAPWRSATSSWLIAFRRSGRSSVTRATPGRGDETCTVVMRRSFAGRRRAGRRCGQGWWHCDPEAPSSGQVGAMTRPVSGGLLEDVDAAGGAQADDVGEPDLGVGDLAVARLAAEVVADLPDV